MNKRETAILDLILLVSVAQLALIACTHKPVSFKQDITPILTNTCGECHTAPDGFGYRKTGLEVSSYEALMKGTMYGPVIIAGDSRRSILNKMIEGRAGEMQKLMHEDGRKGISQEEIMTLRIWVDEGALNN